MSFLDKLFGRGSGVQPKNDVGIGIVRTVRCNRCGALVTVRIDGRNDLSLNDDGSAYFVRKTLVDDRCFTRMQLELTFDLSRHETGSEVIGGTIEH